MRPNYTQIAKEIAGIMTVKQLERSIREWIREEGFECDEYSICAYTTCNPRRITGGRLECPYNRYDGCAELRYKYKSHATWLRARIRLYKKALEIRRKHENKN